VTGAPFSIDRRDIFNFRRLSPTLTTSGQPSEEDFAAMAAAGIGTVINLALPDSPRALADEAGTLGALGLRYIAIPVDFTAPREEDFAAFVIAYEGLGDAPAHIHCAANYRVAAFLYRYRRERLSWSDEDARPDLDAIWQPNPLWSAFIGLD
jgi:protein tyrosine phosphatase (PTP) superfamily phosphohydrolase (DUF442 family)